MATKVFIEVVEFATRKVVHTVDVTEKSESMRERVNDGMQHNLDHERFYTRTVKERKCLR